MPYDSQGDQEQAVSQTETEQTRSDEGSRSVDNRDYSLEHVKKAGVRHWADVATRPTSLDRPDQLLCCRRDGSCQFVTT